jgi:pseudouridine-5'-phosphate glycosidase
VTHAPLEVSPEVQEALSASRAVVALESTIVAHGLPWPESLEVGLALEAAIRSHGAVPATVAVVDGRLCVGLPEGALEAIARDPQRFGKAGLADLGVLVARGLSGATTVSATVFAASRAGVRVFATGGIGGVHRGDVLDVSSDLAAIARHPIAVVSAGAKAILDLPRTLEMLETLGVLVLGAGVSEFPAFYTRSCGLPLEHRVDSPEEAAAVCRARWALGDATGVLVAHPIPAEAALPEADVSAAIAHALAAAAQGGIRGKALTPFLLAAVATATGRRSLAANRALAVANAHYAARMAVELARAAG